MNFREKAQILNEFALKLFAFAFMALDHIGLFLLSYRGSGDVAGLVLRAIGRLAFPLFAFMLAEGMRKSHHPGKYLLRLTLMWALVTVAQLVMFYGFSSSEIGASTNAFTDLILGGLFLYCLSLPGWKKSLSGLPLLAILATYVLQVLRINSVVVFPKAFPLFLFPGYSLFGFALILGFYYSKPLVDRISSKYLSGSGQSLESFQETRAYQGLLNSVSAAILFLVTLLGWAISYIPSFQFDVVTMQGIAPGTVGQTWCLLSALLLFLYNGKRGPDGKAIRICTYAFYPVHLAVIFLTFLLIFGY